MNHQAPPLDPRITERRNPRTANIDLASSIEIVDLMNAEDRSVADAVASQREQIARLISLVEDEWDMAFPLNDLASIRTMRQLATRILALEARA